MLDAHATQQRCALGRGVERRGDLPQHEIADQWWNLVSCREVEAVVRAEMSLQLTIQIRNKLVQAYQDIQNMPI